MIEQTQQLNKNWFFKHLPNGEEVLRKWMVYSPSRKAYFAFVAEFLLFITKKLLLYQYLLGDSKSGRK